MIQHINQNLQEQKKWNFIIKEVKKSKKKKKKNKKNKIDNVVYEENNLSDDNDPIVENFKHDLNDFSFHDNNKKIKPNFSKKWLTKIERMIN